MSEIQDWRSNLPLEIGESRPSSKHCNLSPDAACIANDGLSPNFALVILSPSCALLAILAFPLGGLCFS